MRTVAEHRQYLKQLAAQVENPAAGFFGPDSVAWRISREMALGLVVLRALLMQVAHAKVAQGVADHSDFTQRPFARAYATFRAQQHIVFGSCEESIEALMRIYTRHVGIRGEVHGSASGNLAASYEANDPSLLFWVYATLIDSMFFGYRTFLPDLPLNEWARFYEEGKLFARLIGIPAEIVPPRLADFDAWMRAAIEGNEVKVSTAGRDLSQALLGMPFGLAAPVTSFLAAATLPSQLRAQFGLPWSPRRQQIFDLLARWLRFVSRHTPQALRTSPTYWLAMRRARAAQS